LAILSLFAAKLIRRRQSNWRYQPQNILCHAKIDENSAFQVSWRGYSGILLCVFCVICGKKDPITRAKRFSQYMMRITETSPQVGFEN
jgi:hypothetical protein